LILSFAGYKQNQWKPLILEDSSALMSKRLALKVITQSKCGLAKRKKATDFNVTQFAVTGILTVFYAQYASAKKLPG
jgi:hypothetical protein